MQTKWTQVSTHAQEHYKKLCADYAPMYCQLISLKLYNLRYDILFYRKNKVKMSLSLIK
jgi:hypothetical protein